MKIFNFLKGLTLASMLVAPALTANADERPAVNFTAACLNVDGLPAQIVGRDVNPDGPGESGTLAISAKLAEKEWDFISFSEDFNFHTQLVSSLSDNYYFDDHRGKIDLNISSLGAVLGGATIDTDGLGFASKKIYPKPAQMNSQDNRVWVEWDVHIGGLNEGADGLLKKGFRYYCMELGNGYEVDVYILHMNSEDSQTARDARTSELNQLAQYIINSNTTRPVIIMGDTNCRYTRDTLKETFIDQINEDPRFWIRDPWVEYMRSGSYPLYGTDALTVSKLGNQKGEVVDKIFYINNKESGVELIANNYLHDDSFVDNNGNPLADHFPIVINFTLKEKDYTGIDELGPEPVEPGKYEGQYYLRNVATGLWMAQGTESWGTRCCGDNVGLLFALNTSDQNSAYYNIKNVNAKSNSYLSFPTIYVDNGDDANATRMYTVVETQNGYLIYTTVKDLVNQTETTYYLGIDPATTLIDFKVTNDLDNCLWELVTEDERKAELATASPIRPIDASFMMKNPKFYRESKNLEADWTITKGRNASYEVDKWFNDENPGHNHNFMLHLWNSSGISSSGRDWTATATVNDLPNGIYTVSFDMLNSTGNLGKVTINGTDHNFPAYNMIDGSMSYASAIDELVAHPNDHRFEFADIAVTNGTLTMVFKKDANKSATATFFDNFQLIYHGPTTIDLSTLISDYTELYNEASAIKNGKMATSVKATLIEKMISPETLTTQDAIIAAANELRPAIEAAKQSITDYKVSKVAIDNRKALVESTNVYTEAAYNAYVDATKDYLTAYENGTLTGVIDDPFRIHGVREANDFDDFLLSAFSDDYNGPYTDYNQDLYINTWSIEGETDGSDFKVPFYEYWVNDGDCLAAATWTAKKSGLVPNRTYTVSAWVRVRLQNGQSDPQGITFQVGDDTPLNVCTGENVPGSQFYLARYAATGKADATGDLTISFIIAANNNISWLSYKNLWILEPNEMAIVDAESDAVNSVYFDADDEVYRANNILLTDAETYANDLQIHAEKVTYTRHFGHRNWQAFYVPVDVNVDDIKEHVAETEEGSDLYEILEFYGIDHDANDNPVAVFTHLQNGMNSAALKANTPYIMMPVQHETERSYDMTLEFDDALIEPTEVQFIEKNGWALVGNYEPVTGLYTEDSYVVSSGMFKKVANDTVVLNPFRVRLVPTTSAAHAQQLMICAGDNEADGIIDIVKDAEEGVFYDLQGRKVMHPTTGIYIFNGMKVAIR